MGERMSNSSIARQGYECLDIEEGGSFEFFLQQLQKLYAQIPDDKKSEARYQFTDGWSGQTITVSLP